MTNREARAAWVEALRSGKYEQNRGSLANEDYTAHCCLGVACEVAIENGLAVRRGERIAYIDETSQEAYTALLPHVVADWLGIRRASTYIKPDGSETQLSKQNDANVPFDKIADIIESEPEFLITKP